MKNYRIITVVIEAVDDADWQEIKDTDAQELILQRWWNTIAADECIEEGESDE